MAIKTSKKDPKSMDELVEQFEDSLVPFKQGDTIEVVVRSASTRKILADVAGLATGIIPEQEFSFDTSELKEGDKVNVFVLSAENDDGYVILSHKRANREALWQTLEDKSKSGEIMTVKVAGANRGGLLVEAGGIDGFIPVSQLSSQHYPRVQSGSSSEIARRLQEMVGQMLKVKVLSVDKNANKLIFSEKMTQGLLSETAAETVKIGDVLEGIVTGIVPFGVFINAGGVEGLVHISEISWDRVVNINTVYQVGQKIKVKVIQIDGNRVSFSVKRLQPDPWIRAYEQYKPGTIVEGEVTRITSFGAFVKLSEHVAGLCHLSQLGENIQDPNKVVRVGEKYPFRLINIEPATHRCSLQLDLGATSKEPANKPKAKVAKKVEAKKEDVAPPKKEEKKVEKKTEQKVTKKKAEKKTVAKKSKKTTAK